MAASYQSSTLAQEKLTLSGWYDEEAKALVPGKDHFPALAHRCAEVLMATPIAGVDMDYNDARQGAQLLGITVTKLVDTVMVPGFRATLALTVDEERALKENPDDHVDLAARKEAVAAVESLVWGSICKDGHTSPVQGILRSHHLLLVEIKDATVQNIPKQRVKVATDSRELIIKHFVETRGAKMVTLSNSIKADCTMVTDTFPALIPHMKDALGLQMTNAMVTLLPVATPDVSKLLGPANGKGRQLSPPAPVRTGH